MSTNSNGNVFYNTTVIGRILPYGSQISDTSKENSIFCFADGPDLTLTKARDDKFDPITLPSENWEVWKAVHDEKLCKFCEEKEGRICHKDDTPRQHHPNCRCTRPPIESTQAGMATKEGQNGADWWLKHTGELPDYYASMENFEKEGWKHGKSPSKYIQGKMMTRGEYKNDDGILPRKPGRTWQEADINYHYGRRNDHRVVWSNDGLIFVTYDHYKTFIEIV